MPRQSKHLSHGVKILQYNPHALPGQKFLDVDGKDQHGNLKLRRDSASAASGSAPSSSTAHTRDQNHEAVTRYNKTQGGLR